MAGSTRLVHDWFSDLQREIDETFARIIDEPWGRAGESDWTPAIDIVETAEGYIISVDLPGICEDEVHVRVQPAAVEIHGSRICEQTVRGAKRIRTERMSGRFRRTVDCGRPVDPDSVTCHCRDGVYEIRLQKKSEHERRHE